ncbi:MAG: response regulator [Nitrospiraceae bacterium]|jgi:CheY-like chemotaxis protein|nr:response regulator [Nitrospiraceae bacterium]
MDKQTPMQPSLAKTILVVDDDPSMRLICVKTLRAEGFTVLEAEGSSESLKILATHKQPIDLLLTDLMLPPPGFQMTSTGNPYPRVHGHEVIQRTLAMKKTFRVILMSSLSEQERKAYRIGSNQVPFLQKPFSVETMMQLVHSVLTAPPLSFDDSTMRSIAQQGVRWYG